MSRVLNQRTKENHLIALHTRQLKEKGDQTERASSARVSAIIQLPDQRFKVVIEPCLSTRSQKAQRGPQKTTKN